MTTTGDLTDTPSLAIALQTPMTALGGTINFATTGFHQEELCRDAGCTGGKAPRRLTVSGAVTAVPEPATFLLMAAPLGALLALRRLGGQRSGR